MNEVVRGVTLLLFLDIILVMDKEQFLISQLTSRHIGDDGAVVNGTIYSMDAFCEDVHFRRRWMTPEQIGRKAMLANISDAVAMNAHPQYALISVAIPRDFSAREITELMRSLEATAAEWGCEIIGGDTVAGDKLHLSITLISHSDAPLMRSGLKVGDLLAYTGVLGSTKQDLESLELGQEILEDSRFYRPTLRADFIHLARPWLRAGMDISDGLYCDTNTLLDLNKYGINISKNIPEDLGTSGEEYEMLFALDPADKNTIKMIADQTATPITIFGEVVQNTVRFPCASHHFG